MPIWVLSLKETQNLADTITIRKEKKGRMWWTIVGFGSQRKILSHKIWHQCHCIPYHRPWYHQPFNIEVVPAWVLSRKRDPKYGRHQYYPQRGECDMAIVGYSCATVVFVIPEHPTLIHLITQLMPETTILKGNLCILKLSWSYSLLKGEIIDPIVCVEMEWYLDQTIGEWVKSLWWL